MPEEVISSLQNTDLATTQLHMDFPFSGSSTSFLTMIGKQHLDRRYCNSFRDGDHLQRVNVFSYYGRLPNIAGTAGTLQLSVWSYTSVLTWKNQHNASTWTAGNWEDVALRSGTTGWNLISSDRTSSNVWYRSNSSLQQDLRSTRTSMALAPYHTHLLVCTGYPNLCFVLPTVLPIQNLFCQ